MTRVTPEHTDARLRAIERAAFTVFARRGSEKATMAEIAREAGLSPGTLYLYYPSKADLLRTVCVDKSTDIRAVFDVVEREGGTPMQQMDRAAHLFADMFESEGYEQQVIVGFEAAIAAAREPEVFGDEMAASSAKLNAALRALVVAAQQAGELDPRLDADRLATVLHAVGLGLRELRLVRRGNLDAHGAFAVLLELLRRAGPQEPAGAGLDDSQSASHQAAQPTRQTRA